MSTVHENNDFLTPTNPRSAPDLVADRQTHSQNHSTRFQCKKCPKSFSRNHNLRLHMHTHEGARPFKCAGCEKSFARKNDRNRHEKIHSDKKEFACGGTLNGKQWGCERAFTRKDGLMRHFSSAAGQACTKGRDDEVAAEEQQSMAEQASALQQMWSGYTSFDTTLGFEGDTDAIGEIDRHSSFAQ